MEGPYNISHIFTHLASYGQEYNQRMFAVAEDEDFLLYCVEIGNGLASITGNLERFPLKRAIESADWPQFIREFFSQGSNQSENMAKWVIGFIGLASLGGSMQLQPEAGLLFMDIFCLLIITAPLVGMAAGWELRDRLLRPLSFEQFESGGRMDGLKKHAHLLAWSALLPLGGLLIPYWIYARNRWWPK